jgi:hypothetical protein
MLGWKRHGCPVSRKGGTAVGATWVANKPAGLKGNECCSLETEPALEVAVRNVAKRRPGHNVGKADVLWEETGESTTGAAGVGVQARRERFAEITSGRSLSQLGLAITGKDPSTKARSRRRREGLGLAHGPVVAKREGQCLPRWLGTPSPEG